MSTVSTNTASHRWRGLLLTLLLNGLAYVRCTQLAPMLVAWCAALMGMVSALLLGFTEQFVITLAWLSEETQWFPPLAQWLGGQLDDAGAVTADGSIRLTSETPLPGIALAWSILSLVMLTVSSIWRYLRRTPPRPPRSLGYKLATVASCALLTVAVMVFGLSVAGAGEDISVADASYSGLLMWAVLWLVSAYGLTVDHLLGRLHERLNQLHGVSGTIDWRS